MADELVWTGNGGWDYRAEVRYDPEDDYYSLDWDPDHNEPHSVIPGDIMREIAWRIAKPVIKGWLKVESQEWGDPVSHSVFDALLDRADDIRDREPTQGPPTPPPVLHDLTEA